MIDKNLKNRMKSEFKILIVDDEIEYLDIQELILTSHHYKTKTAQSAKQALKILERESFDLVLTDLIMPEMNGIELLEVIKDKYSDTEVIISTGYGSVENAVQAMKKGAFSYFIKSHNPDELLLEIEKLIKLNAYMVKYRDQSKVSGNFIFETRNSKFDKTLNTIKKAANSDVNILILGESGVGKEIIAQYIHQLSLRTNNPFVPVNCHAFSENLLESELFGHEKGAFTGANDIRIGRFEAANQGTLFLDEIGDTSLNTQVKLLRALETKAIERIGSNVKHNVDYRLVCATNRELKDLIDNGNFREDLFYRISTITINIPPLRERKEDLPVLIKFFFDKIKVQMEKEIKEIDDEVFNYLLQYDYPGNIRELKNIIERLVVLSDNGVISKDDLPEHLSTLNIGKETLRSYRAKAEREFIISALEKHGYNMTKTAEDLGISRRQLFNKVDEYKINKG